MKYILIILPWYYVIGWIILIDTIKYWIAHYISNVDDIPNLIDKVVFAIGYWFIVWVVLPLVLPIAQIRIWYKKQLKIKKEEP